MIYLIGGAPRSGKSILGQRFSAKLKIGWTSTDLLIALLQLKGDECVKNEWNASPEAIRTAADWFFPYLERFIWGATSLSDSYTIEGVDFLPEQVAQLSSQYPIRSVFLGCSHMSLERFTHFPGRSRGYANLPEDMRRQIIRDVPKWSEFVRQEAERFDYSYVDTSHDFQAALKEAEAILMSVSS